MGCGGSKDEKVSREDEMATEGAPCELTSAPVPASTAVAEPQHEEEAEHEPETQLTPQMQQIDITVDPESDLDPISDLEDNIDLDSTPIVNAHGKFKYEPSKVTLMYHVAGEMSFPTEFVNRFFPAMGDISFARAIVGLESKHGQMPWDDGTAVAKTNQDRGCFVYPFAGDERQALFCVFDGHGEEGHWVSEFVMTRIRDVMAAQVKQHKPPKALHNGFVQITEQLKKATHIDTSQSGTTGVVALVRGNEMWIANVGDSRAVVGRKSPMPEHGGRLLAVDLTMDQKPDSPMEMARIKKRGGFISPEDKHGPCRVYESEDREQGGLTLGRAVGDFSLEKVGVICEPVVTHHTFTRDDQVVVLGSDGVFEFISNQEVVEIASQHASASRACSELTKEAMLRWVPDEKSALYRDDITACVFRPPLWLSS